MVDFAAGRDTLLVFAGCEAIAAGWEEAAGDEKSWLLGGAVEATAERSCEAFVCAAVSLAADTDAAAVEFIASRGGCAGFAWLTAV